MNQFHDNVGNHKSLEKSTCTKNNSKKTNIKCTHHLDHMVNTQPNGWMMEDDVAC